MQLDVLLPVLRRILGKERWSWWTYLCIAGIKTDISEWRRGEGIYIEVSNAHNIIIFYVWNTHQMPTGIIILLDSPIVETCKRDKKVEAGRGLIRLSA